MEVLYEYRAFGEQLKRLDASGADTEDSAKYSYGGKELDDTELYYFNARYYDAAIGRFVNVDPIQDGSNWYVYVRNNPLGFVDPTGLWELKFGISIGGAALKFRIAIVGDEWDSDIAVGVGAGAMFKFDIANNPDQISQETQRLTAEISGKVGVEAGPFAGLDVEVQAVAATEDLMTWTDASKLKVSGTMPNQGGALGGYIQYDAESSPQWESDVEVNTDVGFDALIFAGIGTDQDEW